MKNRITFLLLFLMITCLNEALAQQADSSAVPETFVYEWDGEEVLMQKYFIVFLKTGENRSQNEEETMRLQKEHLQYLGALYEDGVIVLNGPTGDDGDIRGFSVYSTATMEEARRLSSEDPMVKAGMLKAEVKPWWLAKGSVVH